MQEKFEHNLRQKLNEFQIEPSASTWQEVERALHTKSKRRGLIWWWLPLTGIILSALVWRSHFSNYNEHTVVKKEPIIINSNKTGNIHDSNSATTIIQHQEQTNEQTESIVKDGTKKASVKSPFIDPENFIKNNAIHHNLLITQDTLKASHELTSNKVNHNKVGKNDDDTSIVIIDSFAKKETEKEISHDLRSGIKKDSTVKNRDAIAKKNIEKKWYKQIMIGGGTFNVSNNIASAGLFTFSNAPSGSLSSPPPTSFIVDPANGFYVNTGLLLNKELNERWSFTTGIKYAYQQNKQITGIKVDSAMGSGAYYYKTGNSNTVTNFAHAIRIPLEIGFTLNPKKTTHLILFAGAETEWMFTNKWLIPDESKFIYFYNSDLLNNFQFNFHSGLKAVFKNNTALALSVDPPLIYLYQFNSKNYYKKSVSFDIRVPFNLSSKKK